MRLFPVLFSFSLFCGQSADQNRFIIKVDFGSAHLILEKNSEAVGRFPVALPMKNPVLPVHGFIESIDLRPVWFPTEKTREAYFLSHNKMLPKRIPFKSPLNALGIGKINIIYHDSDINPLVKIHGTNDPNSIGKRVTRGCIRMKNNDFLELVRLLGDGKERILVIFE